MKLTKEKLYQLIMEQYGSDNLSIKRYFYSVIPYEGFRDTEQRNTSYMNRKPKGLWYACGDSWREWVQIEMPHWMESYNHLYEIKINPSNMLLINSPELFKQFEEEYGTGPCNDWGDICIDWQKVASSYSGIEICPYRQEFRMKSDWYYPWDVASGCIWGNEAVISVTEVPFDTDMNN